MDPAPPPPIPDQRSDLLRPGCCPGRGTPRPGPVAPAHAVASLGESASPVETGNIVFSERAHIPPFSLPAARHVVTQVPRFRRSGR
jgi:hypothetical protein